MRESPDKNTVVPDADIDAVVRRESEEALHRFRSSDFAARLKTRFEAPLPRRPFFLFRKPVLVPALGVLILAAAATFLFLRSPSVGNGRVEAGFRLMTDVLGRSEYFQDGGGSMSDGYGETPGRTEITPFTAVLFRAAAGSKAAPESAAPEKEGPPLRPLFSSRERVKILYGDKAIFRVLANITNQKEV